MAFFIATGVVSNDVVRRETTKGVLTTFRLETGAPRGRKLWIDIECWAHLAGTIGRHGSKGRGVSVSGRLTQKTWRDKSTGDARQRIVVTALDVELFRVDRRVGSPIPNEVMLSYAVHALQLDRSDRIGLTSRFEARAIGSRRKMGSLTVAAEYWQPKTGVLRSLKTESDSPFSDHLCLRQLA